MRAVAEIAICLSLLLAGSAEAVTLVLRPDGTGDVATFQAGMDKLIANQPHPAPYDTLLVEPGYYDESVSLPNLHYSMHITIHCPGGSDATVLRALGTSDSHSSRHVCRVEGLRVETHVRMATDARAFDWFGCRFDEGFSVLAESLCLEPNFFDCEFRGPVVLDHYNMLFSGAAFDRCRFIQAPLRLRSDDCGDLLVRDCVFENADTLVVATPWDQHDAIVFVGCTFRNARVGLVTDALRSGYWQVSNCRFEDIDDAAILRLPLNDSGYSSRRPLSVSGSRFERCGSAVVSHTLGPSRLSMAADTISMVGATAIESSGLVSAGIGGLVLKGAGGSGVILRALAGASNNYSGLTLSNSTISGCASTGVVIDGRPDSTNLTAYVSNCEIHENGGDGLTVAGRQIEIEDNLVYGNRGAGIIATFARADVETSEVSGNTSVSNVGPGLVVQAAEFSKDGALVVSNNLIASNKGDGLTLKAGPAAEARHNDSWLNSGLAYVGAVPADQNLAVDPLFCDPSVSDFHVRESSACAPSGPYGQIGALGVGCLDGPVRKPSGAPALVVDQRPILAIRGANPSMQGRLSVQFETSDEAELSVYDLAGRRIAFERVVPARSGMSNLTLPSGLRNGLYLVRLAQGGKSTTRRLVLLR